MIAIVFMIMIMIIVINPKGPSTQIVGFQGPKTIQGMDFGDLKPYYLGTRSLWVKNIHYYNYRCCYCHCLS